MILRIRKLKEIWRIYEYDHDKTNYEISNYGNLRNYTTKKLINKRDNNTTYRININCKQKTILICEMVAKMFIPNIDNLKYVKHKDCDITNNMFYNLYYSDNKQELYKKKKKYKEHGICWHRIKYKGIKTNYEISELGSIRHVKNLIPLKFTKDGSGYYQVKILVNDKYKNIKPHRFVAKYFVDNPKDLNIVNHIDGDKTNNIYTNLEWCTQQENCIHAIENNLCKSGSDRYSSVYTEEFVEKVCDLLYQNKSTKEMCIILNIQDKDKSSFRNLVNNIKNKRSWKKIYNKYDK